MLFKFQAPDINVWTHLPSPSTPVPKSPFENELLSWVFQLTMNLRTPLTIAVVYFTSVHLINSIIRRKQIRKYNTIDLEMKMVPIRLTKRELKKLPAVPHPLAQMFLFKGFVLIHNIVLCLYSAWTFLGFAKTIALTMYFFESKFLENKAEMPANKLDLFVYSMCDAKNGVFSRSLSKDGTNILNLEVFGWLFYISKFYEVIDTIIILLKGKPSSLLQSYHHAGAMLGMWAGIRYQSPPIWIFVVFNSFIHTLMYFYFSLSCLNIRVPKIFKKMLTSLQIAQFVIGGSVAVLHGFISILDSNGAENSKWIGCISSPGQALTVSINVFYLMPLTALFTAFYIESYLSKKRF